MISKNIIFDDFQQNTALWCNENVDSGELARVADVLIKQRISFVSVMPDMVAILWPWIENTNTRILSRFYLKDKKITEEQISELTVNINNVFKNGADGAMVFLPCAALTSLVEQTHVVRGDLFFNKYLSVCVDVAEIDSCDWEGLFQNLQKINASALTLTLNKDTGDKSDFVGRIYGMLESWNAENNFDLHFVLGQDFYRIEQVLRLIKSVKPELINNVKCFVNY